MNGEVTFRRAVVGGFNRDDVMEYISGMATVNGEQQKLRIALRESEAKIKELEAELEAKNNDLAQVTDTSDEQEKLNEALKESEATVEKLKAELESKNEQLAQAEKEIEALRGRLGESDELKQKLQQYESKTASFDDTADKLMRESMAYADRYVASANLMAGNIRKETLTKVKDADARVNEMLAKAAVFSKECESFENTLNFFKTQLEEIQKTFAE
ncbi:MAG: hypothetical protein IJZ57_05535 [Clostridia bacterium]|nr:hypothetical protein [Clostridia bacterium]